MTTSLTPHTGAAFEGERAYRRLVEEHRWTVPDRYNMAADVADRHPGDRLALVFEDHTGHREEVLWQQIQDRSRQVAAHLHALGVRKGDRVAVLLPQRPDTPATYLGVLRTGAVLVTMSLLWADEPIRYRLADSGAEVLVTETSALDRAAGFGGTVVDVDDPAIGALPPEYATADTSPDDPALIFYTSGTTGTAKGIVHAHRTLLGHNEFRYCHDLRPGDVFYGAGDWAWSMAKLMGPLRAGAVHLVYRPAGGFDPAGLLAAMSRNKVTTALVNPTFLRKMMQDLPDAGSHHPQALRVVCSSNEPLTPDVIEWFRAQFGVTLLDYYGSTESYPLLGNFPGVPVKPGSMGRPLPGWDVALLDAEDREVPVGQPGEICLRAGSNPQFPLGYWNRPEASAETFGTTWYRTKDQAVMDEEGYFWFLGRTDDVIKTSGYRVGPYEVEAVLRGHPAVADAGVVGVPDAVRGQAVKAWIELSPGYEADGSLAEDITRFARAAHSRFAYPRLIEFVDELPRSATGKIQRAALRARDLGPAGPGTTTPPRKD
ncbi:MULTISPECIES: AMP-binding protein [unclassified Streptomyces]|uniref:acyl-CoA synthetase n=1 Tax=unclassified Streptomyces TaxID=2593676 RepID=UPI0001C19E1F|nr:MULTISPECIES: AMP-binding protein [unclassified Streptomyces]AEN13441.1 AMP-dependent synthetase and ligase [Streptomyces sp. SirexAA-E]MYR68043.1 AMP-binding protein [Streptomyces sp. SID4939]MYT67111.1 AMP-binding protein [Streptomyces sp. SID8357]MYT84755.1 AMP-binding protein [Streptomyces sp. SID8360]MYU31594.1 AMP-binding protein [Streptomyces sp. SID8358]